jgi:hypothetical protein
VTQQLLGGYLEPRIGGQDLEDVLMLRGEILTLETQEGIASGGIRESCKERRF